MHSQLSPPSASLFVVVLSSGSVLVVAVLFLAACLVTVYLLFLRINRASTPVLLPADSIEEEQDGKSSSEASQSEKNHGKGKKKKNAKKASPVSSSNQVNQTPASSASPSPSTQSQSSVKFDDEDDILLLAQLKGYNVSGVRRRGPANNAIVTPTLSSVNTKTSNVNVKPIKKEPVAPLSSSSSSSSSSASDSADSNDSLSSLTPEELAFIASEATAAVEAAESSGMVVEEVIIEANIPNESIESSVESESIDSEEIIEDVVIVEEVIPIKSSVKSSPVSTSNDWSSVPTREEEAIKSLKNKVLDLQAQLKQADAQTATQERALEQARRRCTLLESEAKEARRLAADQKRSADNQIATLRSLNADLSEKLGRMESVIVAEASALKSEAEEAKSQISQLKGELVQLSAEARRKEAETDAKIQALMREKPLLEEQAGESAHLKEELVAAQNNIEKLTQSLQDYRQELEVARLHAGSEEIISELKAKLEEASRVEAALKHEVQHHQAETRNAHGASAALHQEIATLKAELEKRESSSNNNNQEDLVGELQLKLAEAEERITALQADVAREMKRADVAKKVYDMKLAELEKKQ